MTDERERLSQPAPKTGPSKEARLAEIQKEINRLVEAREKIMKEES